MNVVNSFMGKERRGMPPFASKMKEMRERRVTMPHLEMKETTAVTSQIGEARQSGRCQLGVELTGSDL